MRYEYRLPDIGEGIAEAELVGWHVKPGDRVEDGTMLADIMTDKATVEIEAPVSGVITEQFGDVGDTVAIGSVLLVIETDEAEKLAEVGVANPAAAVASETASSDTESEPFPGVGRGPEPEKEPRDGADRRETPTLDLGLRQGTLKGEAGASGKRRILASPAVRARATALGIDLADVKPSQGDHIRHADLDAWLSYHRGQGYVAAAAPRADETIKVAGLRRRIADKMAEAKRHIPHFSYVEEIEVTALEAMRADLNANRGGRPKLTLLPFLIVAMCKALPGFPMINARYDDEAGVVTRHGAVHLGMATQADAGLYVPVIRDAQAKNVWQLADEITRLSQAVRDGSITSAELSGSTLTISSLGPLGGIASTPVINRPEVAILAPNRIVERPVFEGDKIRPAKLMNLSISCDHRVVDGWDAASFIQSMRKLLETPVLLFAD
ncbi:MAG: 2-oxo acid dehydrogenase subunit E2 [Sphingobium sp.]|nr:2-oxo acid dehydrogenase subunit E2 [Sphingobium sp.]